LHQRPAETGGVDTLIVVDGVPKVESARREKLQSVIKKLFSSLGRIDNEHYPVDEDGKTKG
jgi:translation initiation factor 3 subunit B